MSHPRTLHPLRSEDRCGLTVYIFVIEGVEHEVIANEPPIYRGGSFMSEKKPKKRGKDEATENRESVD
jgi:hypothetical protein